MTKLRGDLRGKKVGTSWMIEEASVRALEENLRLKGPTSSK